LSSSHGDNGGFVVLPLLAHVAGVHKPERHGAIVAVRVTSIAPLLVVVESERVKVNACARDWTGDPNISSTAQTKRSTVVQENLLVMCFSFELETRGAGNLNGVCSTDPSRLWVWTAD
jgi:hypothetical protein